MKNKLIKYGSEIFNVVFLFLICVGVAGGLFYATDVIASLYSVYSGDTFFFPTKEVQDIESIQCTNSGGYMAWVGLAGTCVGVNEIVSIKCYVKSCVVNAKYPISPYLNNEL